MGFLSKELWEKIDAGIDLAQATFVPKKKELMNGGIDAAQNIMSLYVDDIDNEDQLIELLKDINEAIAKYDGSVPTNVSEDTIDPA